MPRRSLAGGKGVSTTEIPKETYFEDGIPARTWFPLSEALDLVQDVERTCSHPNGCSKAKPKALRLRKSFMDRSG